MADVPTFADLFDAAEREALIRPTSFNPEIIRTDGSDVNIAFAVSAAMAEEVARFAQASNNETFLATSESEGGEVLQRWAYDRYNLTKQEAQAAVSTLVLRRTNATPGTTVEKGSVFGTRGGQTFRTVNDVPFGNGIVGPLSVLAVAEQTGPAGNVAVSTINTLISNLDDTTITVDNPEPAAGGSDEETDEEFAARARDFFVNARRGTREAIEAGCLEVPGIQQVTIIENLDPSTGLANFRIQAIIADRDGQANSALAATVRQNLNTFRALGVPVLVTAGTPEFVDVVIVGIQFASTVNTTNVIEQARNAIVAAINGLAPGVVLEQALIFAALKSVDGLLVPDTAITAPAGDLVPSLGGVLRTTPDRVLINQAA
jgi:uncharacterized phage protein gp47/JayE